GEPVSDAAGNTYGTIYYQIGGKTWMAENLKTTSYSNGDPIPFISETEAWRNDSLGAYCYWENDPSFIEDYGMFYNYYVVKDPRGVCPSGYHVPDNIEWATLREHIAEYSSSNGSINSQLREEGEEFWWSSSNPGNNFSGFSARGAGLRSSGIFGDYANILQGTYFWTSTEDVNPLGETVVSTLSLGFNGFPVLNGDTNIEHFGHSLRCVEDD
ncbi:MAG: fibrobacter succinogenes major paralogous domain-containing protein, partial [Cryomorphaceae bacterium]